MQKGNYKITEATPYSKEDVNYQNAEKCCNGCIHSYNWGADTGYCRKVNGPICKHRICAIFESKQG